MEIRDSRYVKFQKFVHLELVSDRKCAHTILLAKEPLCQCDHDANWPRTGGQISGI